jgi:hypothetical protein
MRISHVFLTGAVIVLAACASGRSGSGTIPVGELDLSLVPAGGSVPKITKLSEILPKQKQTIEITGTGLGTSKPYKGDSTGYLVFYIGGGVGWAAGCGPFQNFNCTVGLDVTSWTNKKITVAGFTGEYGEYGFELQKGNTVYVDVWNPQSQQGPAQSKTVTVK